jgi:hypothetical protein
MFCFYLLISLLIASIIIFLKFFIRLGCAECYERDILISESLFYLCAIIVCPILCVYNTYLRHLDNIALSFNPTYLIISIIAALLCLVLHYLADNYYWHRCHKQNLYYQDRIGFYGLRVMVITMLDLCFIYMFALM